MTVFRGRVALKLDPKGRLSFPQIHRESLAKSTKLMITNSLYQGEPCLDILTWKQWQALEAKVAQLPVFDEHVQAFQRFYLASGTACELDSQGRILLPQIFREYAGLGEEIVFVGMGGKIEVWSAERWEKIFGNLKVSFESVQKGLSALEREKK